MARLSEVRTLGESDFAATQPQVSAVVGLQQPQVMRVVVEHVTREQPKLSLAELRTMDLAQQMAWRWLRRGIVIGMGIVVFFNLVFARELIWLSMHR